MCNLLVLFASCVLLTRCSVHALPTATKDGDKMMMKDGMADSNKTADNMMAGQKSPTPLMVGRSMRPVMLPFYQSFVSSPSPSMPLKYPRVLQMPVVPPRISSYSINPSSSFLQRPQIIGYSGSQPQQMPVQPMPVQPMMMSSQFLPSAVPHQQQSLMPPTYNYAPYASNSYASFGYRSTADDDEADRLTNVALLEQPLQSGEQYSAGSYVVNQGEQPTQYVNEYGTLVTPEYQLSARAEPREVLSMGSPSRNDVLPLMSDQIYYEMTSPYFARPELAAAYSSELQPPAPHVPQMTNYKITEPSTYLSMARPYANLENMNWLLPRGDNNGPHFVLM